MNKPFFAFSLVITVVVANEVCVSTSSASSQMVAAENSAKQEAQDENSNSGALVTPAWVEKHLSDPNVRLIGLGQKKSEYELAHIPGEVFVDWRTEITDPAEPDRFNLPSPDQLEKLLSRIGVTNDMTIVLSDNLSSRLSTRVFWTLRSYGHKNVKVLDGGRKAWVQSGRDFTSQLNEIKPTKYVLGIRDMNLYANIADVRHQLENQNSVLIDGRPAPQYTGEVPGKAYHNAKEHKRKGHIVSARNIIWSENFNDDGTFKSPEELKKLYQDAAVTPDKHVITYCNEGLHAAPPWFVLTELLGYTDVKLYDDSMAEWANRDDTPMATGDK